jgi:hypothetical protein
MINKLINLANNLDKIGLGKEADRIDDVLKSVIKMIGNERIHEEDDEGDDAEVAFDLFINNRGEAVGAEQASGPIGSTCIMNEEISGGGLGFSDLNETNITNDEAFSAGCAVCGDKSNSCGHDHY